MSQMLVRHVDRLVSIGNRSKVRSGLAAISLCFVFSIATHASAQMTSSSRALSNGGQRVTPGAVLREYLIEIGITQALAVYKEKLNADIGKRRDLQSLRKEIERNGAVYENETISHLVFDIDIAAGDYERAYRFILPIAKKHVDEPSQIRLALAEALTNRLDYFAGQYVLQNNPYRVSYGSSFINGPYPSKATIGAFAASALNGLTRAGSDGFFYLDLAEKLDPQNIVMARDFALMHRSRGQEEKAQKILRSAISKAFGANKNELERLTNQAR